MSGIVFTEMDEQGLGLIGALWAQLNRHHMDRSTHFKDHYQKFTFEKRKTALLKKAAAGKLHVCLACDSGRTVGYCVASLSAEEEVEIESLFVDEGHRRRGIGDGLMRRALAWADAQGAKIRKVEVAKGNEAAFRFYEKYGFFPRKTVLQYQRG
ncbi:MAG TPA: GNAT family N-acetyltransferase [Anaeromyxobacteraceae bacterium]|nr:GNAT family N-acetyltransferase [Anaeromyxobacteraceae bacterium]